MTLKELKEQFRIKASKNYDEFFGTETLLNLGFERKWCPKCKKFFWAVGEREVCGDPECTGSYEFIGVPSKRVLSFTQVWREFSKLFEEMGYTPIERYPVVARWRDDTDFVQASIYDFQPHVVSGAVEPPANPLVVPQSCLRFVDLDNVGITGRHLTSFVMIGQHAFVKPEEYDQNLYLAHIYRWLDEGLKIPREELVFHEDGWAGGGNGGACMEFFSKGCELGNQVYMLYEITESGYKDLDLKVLDMGAGQERFAWYSQGTNTIYEASFPGVVEKLLRTTGFEPKSEILMKFIPYSGLLNFDEVYDIEKVWKDISKKIDLEVKTLKNMVYPLAAIYSIADHVRALLFALSDGALPSNMGGGYNLRVLLRRIFSFLDRYGWEISIEDVFQEHAKFLKPQYPELSENLEEIFKILESEREKFRRTREKVGRVVARLLKRGEITRKKLIEAYDSHGVTPDLIEEFARKKGMKVEIPKDFYMQVTQRHEILERKPKKATELLLPPTEILYYSDVFEFKAKVLKIIDDKVVLSRTAFYPEGGGQESDRGFIDECRVLKVEKQGKVILHEMEKINFEEGDEVIAEVDQGRRKNLTRHHTATHILNGAARKVLGNHIWQAGALKTEDKARLDITHYKPLTSKEVKKIERVANEIVLKDLKLEKDFLPKDEAEKKFGFRLYQGGVVPSKDLRVVNISDFDVEACGGTHASSTSEVGFIKILKTEKIQDGIIRLEFASGLKALEHLQKDEETLKNICETFRVDKTQIEKTAERFFEEWKERGKEIEELKKRISKLIAEKEKISMRDELTTKVKKEDGTEIIRKPDGTVITIELDGIKKIEKQIDVDVDELREIAFKLVEDNTVLVLHNKEKNLIVVCGEKAVENNHHANEIIKDYGKGGGKKKFAQGVKD